MFRVNEFLEDLAFRAGYWLGSTLWPVLLVLVAVAAVAVIRRVRRR